MGTESAITATPNSATSDAMLHREPEARHVSGIDPAVEALARTGGIMSALILYPET